MVIITTYIQHSLVEAFQPISYSDLNFQNSLSVVFPVITEKSALQIFILIHSFSNTYEVGIIFVLAQTRVGYRGSSRFVRNHSIFIIYTYMYTEQGESLTTGT